MNRKISVIFCIVASLSADIACSEDTSASIENAQKQFKAKCPNGALAKPIANCSPEPPAATGDPRVDCVIRINQYRWECQCLPPLKRWKDGEACADQQAAYDAQHKSAHAGFSKKICSLGNGTAFAQNECPNWGDWQRTNKGCLQRMWDEGPNTGDGKVHGHYESMSSTTYKQVACGGAEGWFVQNFKN